MFNMRVGTLFGSCVAASNWWSRITRIEVWSSHLKALTWTHQFLLLDRDPNKFRRYKWWLGTKPFVLKMFLVVRHGGTEEGRKRGWGAEQTVPMTSEVWSFENEQLGYDYLGWYSFTRSVSKQIYFIRSKKTSRITATGLKMIEKGAERFRLCVASKSSKENTIFECQLPFFVVAIIARFYCHDFHSNKWTQIQRNCPVLLAVWFPSEKQNKSRVAVMNQRGVWHRNWHLWQFLCCVILWWMRTQVGTVNVLKYNIAKYLSKTWGPSNNIWFVKRSLIVSDFIVLIFPYQFFPPPSSWRSAARPSISEYTTYIDISGTHHNLVAAYFLLL